MMNRFPRPSTLSLALASAMPAAGAKSVLPDAPPAYEVGSAPVNLLKRFKANTAGRDFVVGDLHGCRAMFDRLLDALEFDKSKDRMFCTGNLGNHGPDTLGCYALLMEPWFHTVAGSVEELLVRAAANRAAFDWPKFVGMGGMWATRLDDTQLLALADKLADLPLCIVVGEGAERFNVIHAEFNGPDVALEDSLEDITTNTLVPRQLTWGTDVLMGKADLSEQDGLSLTFVGHMYVARVGKIGNHVYLDTGAHLSERGHHGPYALSACEPAAGRFTFSRAVPAAA